MLGLERYFSDNLTDLDTILDGFNSGMKQQLVSGLTNAAKSLWMASVYKRRKKTLLIVTHNLYQAQKLYDDLEECLNADEVYLYPVNDLIASEISIASPELRGQRIEVLNLLAQNKKGVIIAPIAAVKRYLAPEKLWASSLVHLKVGSAIDLDSIIKTLTAIGYERETMVNGPGEFSVRGGIIDIYPLTEDYPVRIELFDDEVDSIRYFDSDTQRSEEKIEEITIGPAKELILYEDQYELAAERLGNELANTLNKVKDKQVKELLTEHVGYEIEQLKEHQSFQGNAKYTTLFYETEATLLDYLPKDALIVTDEISRVQEMSEQLDKEEAEWQTALLQKGEVVSGVSLSLSWQDLHQALKHPVLYMSLFLRHHGQIQPENIVNISCRSMQNFHGQINVLKHECERWEKGNYAVVMLAANHDRAKRMENVLQDYGIDAQVVEDQTRPVPGKRQIIIGYIDGGFELPQQKLVVITEKEIFANKAPKTSRRQKKISSAERLKNYNELKVGDYVVHVDHGIGKYIGIETLEVNGIHKDYLQIVYKGNDKLYVPVENIDQVQKYIGSEGKEPKLYALGGSEWKRVKSKARSSVQDIADDLIKLYAEREASQGHAFQKDGPEQREFEAAFPYQETEDQLQAIEEIKKDMENIKPMDRLLCGDVGYGKTEVALRAAFKAIAEGKQVAFLVPTTILAQQHYETAKERFEGFAVNIRVLSRFGTRKEHQETIKGLKKGTIDMVVGTHRLLSKDVVFKDLGLLIVDEEQRFGVTHKEKIKKMKANVDVLTLTATPIPRTLHMSMLGVRDLSIIETPPENRFPVQTYVTEYSGTLVREAIERELARDGQVYFLYNRVESIQRMAEQISALVPDARVVYAHGQMKENELEAVMVDFLEGAYDVLVSTTIIETGVDIPNVNTLIVYDADRMGLSQLYQLRGRVGRSNRVAYAYFTYQRDKVVNEVAEKRLQAIKEFTELGSGFKIAMRDLSIRGAGNLLGAQQHGFIDSVGFDLYSKMLKDAIEERKGSAAPKREHQVNISVDADAYIPDTYIEDSLQKIDMYKKFKSIETLNDIDELHDEMVDRFGDYPQEVADLFTVAKLNVIAHELGIETIKQNNNQLTLIFSEEGSEKIDRVKLFEVVSERGRQMGIGADGQKIKLTLKVDKSSSSKQLNDFYNLIEKIYEGQSHIPVAN
ncbi:transcription-repair coupling factor (superfamily II helicase) [Scopulibacillus daqui]|uniref:Transcription-repair-coupling factor n=1 Tax=Scopulibacillus daqui TaxID=1469162 RepID=A0ABS2Q2E5_9BACL|nr:transcription-repair coupling factor [Scopulibacillus daqui]MBM7646460.1 transcription-repair coupling factor (superfamily II helicase) [Scopulibacillus daqui]